MIYKQEKADGTILVSGSIENYADFKNCVCGCATNKTQQNLLIEFAQNNKREWCDYLLKVEKDYYLQERKRKL